MWRGQILHVSVHHSGVGWSLRRLSEDFLELWGQFTNSGNLTNHWRLKASNQGIWRLTDRSGDVEDKWYLDWSQINLCLTLCSTNYKMCGPWKLITTRLLHWMLKNPRISHVNLLWDFEEMMHTKCFTQSLSHNKFSVNGGNCFVPSVQTIIIN